MGHALTRRPYLLVGFFHMIIGLLLFSCGVVWLMFTFFMWPQHRSATPEINWTAQQFLEKNGWANQPMEHQTWMWLVYTVQIWTGFWIMLSGCFAMCVKDQGCLEKFFFFTNIVSMLIFSPAAVVLSLELFFNVTIAGAGPSLEEFSFIYSQHDDGRAMFIDLNLNSTEYGWILAFPIAGLSLGFIEFVLSMVSCSVAVCCRPTRSYTY